MIGINSRSLSSLIGKVSNKAIVINIESIILFYISSSTDLHPESVILSMLRDPNRRIRKRAVDYIKKARKLPKASFDEDDNPYGFRKFVPPGSLHFEAINWKAKYYYDVLFWNKFYKWYITEPTITKHLTLQQLDQCIENEKFLFSEIPDGKGGQQRIIPDAKCHSQGIERLIPLVGQACAKTIGLDNQHAYAVVVIESRNMFTKDVTKTEFLTYLECMLNPEGMYEDDPDWLPIRSKSRSLRSLHKS